MGINKLIKKQKEKMEKLQLSWEQLFSKQDHETHLVGTATEAKEPDVD